MKNFSLLRFLLLVLILAPSPWLEAAEQAELYRYKQHTGSQVDYFDWQLNKGAVLHLQTRQQSELTETRFNSDLSTLSWKIQNSDALTDLTVERRGDRLVMQGTFKGELVSKEEQIDAAPWYQALSVSLRQFVDPEQESVQFWTIRADTLEVHQLQAARQKNSAMEIANDSEATIQLKIQPTGWRAPFWSANYWLRENDGVFLRYQGRSGLPGAPPTTITMVSHDSRKHHLP